MPILRDFNIFYGLFHVRTLTQLTNDRHIYAAYTTRCHQETFYYPKLLWWGSQKLCRTMFLSGIWRYFNMSYLFAFPLSIWFWFIIWWLIDISRFYFNFTNRCCFFFQYFRSLFINLFIIISRFSTSRSLRIITIFLGITISLSGSRSSPSLWASWSGSITVTISVPSPT